MVRTKVRTHLRRTQKGRVPVRQHYRIIKVKFSDGRIRKVPVINPMRPKDLANHQIPKDGWIAEEKKDGSLTLQYYQDGAVAYLNRRGVNKTAVYPELADDEIKKIKAKGLTIIEGETYALKGRKDNFENFLKRDLLQNPEEAKRRMKTYPLRFEAFDIIMKDKKDLTSKPLSERKKILEQTVPPTKEFRLAKFSRNPAKLTARLKKDHTVEGVVYKKESSEYKPGKHTDWLKNKFRKMADTVIMGYEPGQGKRKDIGILKVGTWDKKAKKVREVADVGTGFTDAELKDIKSKLDKGDKLFARVEYLHLGSRGRLRVPSFKGLRDDLKTVKETHL